MHTWAITDYTSTVPNGEYARFGVVLGNRYYFEAGGSNIHSFDLGNPALPPLDHGVNLSWYGSAAADRPNAVIYVASLDGTQLWRYEPATNTAVPLTGGSSGWHSSLAYVPPAQGPVYAQIETWDPEHLHLLDWAATGGDVIVEPDRLVWTGVIVVPQTITWLPPYPVPGQVVAFSGSTAGGTLPITFAWDFGDGGSGVGSPIDHTYMLSATYTVVMTATNSCGSDVATHDVVVGAVGPTYSIYLPIVFKGFAP